jgi:hypothetical protein
MEMNSPVKPTSLKRCFSETKDSLEEIINNHPMCDVLFERCVGSDPTAVTTIGFGSVTMEEKLPEIPPVALTRQATSIYADSESDSEWDRYEESQPLDDPVVLPPTPIESLPMPTWREFYEMVHGNRDLSAFDYPARELAEQHLECGQPIELLAHPFPDLSLMTHCAKDTHRDDCLFCRVNFKSNMGGSRVFYSCPRCVNAPQALVVDECLPYRDVFDCTQCSRRSVSSCPFLRLEHVQYCMLIQENVSDILMAESLDN